MGGKLIEPKNISDFNNNLVAMLPMGFILMTSTGKKYGRASIKKAQP